MPFLNTSIVIAETDCPRFTDGRRILSNLFYTNKATPLLPLLTRRDLNVILDYLQSHLKNRVVYDAEIIKHLQSLPLFENIDNSYTSVWGKNAYIWPANALAVAYQKWLEGYDAVFIKEYAKWSQLGTAEQLTISTIFTENLYTQFIFPHFHQMNSGERYQHLEYIRDRLYRSCKSNSENYYTIISSYGIRQHLIDQQQRALSFIGALKSLRCIGNDGSPLRSVSAFCNHTCRIFNAFSAHFLFLPDNYRSKSSEWLAFFIELGLQQTVSQEKFIEFCQETANGKVTDIKMCSNVLLEYLLKIQKVWHSSSNANFLQRVSVIPFVQQEPVPQFTWLLPTVCPVSQLVKLRGSAPVANASLLWTVKPIVMLPIEFSSGTAGVAQMLGIVINPSTEDILQNVSNICKSPYSQQSLFVNYPKNLACPINGHHTLLDIMFKTFSHFNLNAASSLSKSNLQVLQALPCIPVHHTNSSYSASTDNLLSTHMVLVKPSCVVHAQWKSQDVKDFHPFLHCLPKRLQSVSTLLQSIGVKDKLELSHLQITLASAFEASEGSPLDKNTDISIKKAIEKLYELLHQSDGSHQSNATALAPLYLPDSNNVLRSSKSLLYGDTRNYWGAIQLDLTGSPYYHFNILLAKYKHSALDICRVLPDSVRPIGLSVACEKVVLVESRGTQDSEVARQLMRTIEIPGIPDGIVSLISKIVTKQDDEDHLKEIVRNYLSNIDIVTVTDLKSQIVLKDSRKCIGTLNITFCYVPGEERLVLYLDSNLSYPVDDDDAYS